MDQIKSQLRTTQVRLLLAFLASLIVGLSVMVAAFGDVWGKVLVGILGVLIGNGLAYAIISPPQIRKRAALLLLLLFPAYAVLGILNLIFGFMPGWASAFFSGSVTLPGSFLNGLVFGVVVVAGARLGRYFTEWHQWSTFRGHHQPQHRMLTL